MISAINSQFQNGAMAELVDALVLGTNLETSEGSSPFRPTRKKLAKIKRNSDYETVYVFGVSYTEGRKEGALVLRNNEVVSLRNQYGNM